MEKTAPVGTCTELVARRRSIGIIGKGTESFTYRWDWCGRQAPSGLCKTHAAKAAKVAAGGRR